MNLCHRSCRVSFPGRANPEETPESTSSVSTSPAKPSHLLFGGVEQKAMAPLPASIETIQLMRESPKMAPTQTVNQVHKLAVQQTALINSANQAMKRESPKMDPGANQVWFRIPAWMAGKWQTKDRQLIGEINYLTGRQTSPRSLSFGYCGEQYGLQQDKDGTCWQVEKVGRQPVNYRVDKHGMAQFDVVESHQPLSSSDTQLVLRKRWRHLTVNPETAEVIHERCFESTLTFKQLDAQTMSVNESVETFDGQGSPISMKLIQTVRVKVAPFQPVDNLRVPIVHG